MKRLMIKDSRLKIFLTIFIFLFINHQSLFINHVHAAESTPSSEIRSKLEELKREIASKAAELKKLINKKLTDKAYIGKIKTKSDSAITLATKNGPRIVNINQDTQFESLLKGKKYSKKLILQEDFVAGLGDIDENQVLTAKRLILLNPIPSTLNPKSYLWGQIVSISDKLVILKDKSLKNISVSLPDQGKVKVTDFVILTGNKDKNDVFEADFVYVIPQGGIIKSKKIATPSAKLATPSASPKPTSSAKKK